MEAAKNLVEMKGVVKKFPGVTALNNISFKVGRGSCFTWRERSRQINAYENSERRLSAYTGKYCD